MSDDESDDDILNYAVFGGNARKKRAKEKEKHRHMANLNRIVASSERHTESIQRIHSLQKADAALQFDGDSDGDGDDASDKKTDGDAVVKKAAKQPSGEETSPKSLFDLNTGSDEMMDESPSKKKRRMQMLEDMQDERSSCLGARKIISFDPKRYSGGMVITFFASKEEAEQNLTHVLQKLEKKFHGDESFQKAVVIPLRRAMEEGCLEELLSRSILCNTLAKYKCEQIDNDITNWLLQVLQSADMALDLRGIAQGALAILIALLKASKVMPSFDRLSNLEPFLSTLECWVDLRRLKCAPETEKASPDEIKTQEDQHNQILPKNIGGLANYLSLWSETLLLMIPEQDISMETLNRCLVALTRIGLDVSTKRRLEDDKGIGNSVSQLLILLINIVAKKVENKEAFSEWIQMAAFGMCEGLDQLGPGHPGSDDQDDECAWICYSAVARLIPDAFSNKNCCELKVAVVIRALESILGKPFSIEENAHLFAESDKQLLDRAKESSTLKTLLFSYVSLKTLQLDDDADFPRCFAIADCSLIAFQAGLLLGSEKDDTSGSEYGSTENAKHILRVSNLLQREMELLCARSNRFAGNDHMRRFNYLMMLRNNIRRQTLDKLKACAGVHKSGQMDLSSFFSGSAEVLASP